MSAFAPSIDEAEARQFLLAMSQIVGQKSTQPIDGKFPSGSFSQIFAGGSVDGRFFYVGCYILTSKKQEAEDFFKNAKLYLEQNIGKPSVQAGNQEFSA